MMKLLRLARVAGVAVLMGSGLSAHASAETFEVKMLNRGEKGPMVFEPDFLEITAGDRVRFVPTHKSHNAATVEGMVPEGVEGFKSRINDEFETGFDKPGFYGIKCSPHYGMGMVMLIKVGDATLPQSYRTVDMPARAKPRFEELFERAEK
ncbi:pseudoazurin [Agrobacterium pusense]|jgi:pseudoazurin|uniref:Pseudoazurin n=4 Tax=Hyphomicrobiales TaxID=356 RepID=A0A1L9CLM5_9HYPH|nr:pseudoazurin [Rhizobium sp. S41]EKJ95659.1 putative pseudoazurin [Bradyrhizobium lupini HPC(L)]KGE82526.1 pseudoazurin [Rhizobium sp. H41]MBM7326325.1 pseudoazurin [Agrobacterium sp. S2]MBW9059516.1 pseudoazurin [Agrobacterium pusense]MCW8279786.1 pseudoazurin [Agrobacterium sp. InxBP2]CAD7059152.1 pseudoazurin [Rhizobium sp. P007]CUW98625.1 Pseudoazurin [Agrobacterium genomosp. 2 str. CFBP 5494]